MASVLPERPIMAHPNALYVCLNLWNGWSAEAYTQAAEEIGVGVTPLSLSEVSAMHQSESVCVCANGAPDRRSLSEGLEKFAGLLASRPPSTVRFRVAI